MMKRAVKLQIGRSEALDRTMATYNQACQQMILLKKKMNAIDTSNDY